MTRILFVTSEAHPLIKTGGLADVSASLPLALHGLGDDVRLILPGYRQILQRMPDLPVVSSLDLPGYDEPVRILEGRYPDSDIPLWLVDAPGFFDRDGGPYQDPQGHDWPDNAWRFALFARAAVEIAMDRAGLGWRAEVVHGNDWQSGLVPALLDLEHDRPATLFTIHNLAYQGLFPLHLLQYLNLPEYFASHHSLEFHGMLSFIKGGLAFADWVTTVSPTYADEIRTAEFGYGLEGLLNHRAGRLAGILNGVDYHTWDPANDKLLPQRYSIQTVHFKKENKAALQAHFGLPEQADTPLFGFIGRMVDQKGIDLILAALPTLLGRGVQCVVLGSGASQFENAFHQLSSRYPAQVGLYIGYNEPLAHLIEAGSDMFLMPSRFEPCGLNQLYSLRYGTPPIVRRTGGLADSVVDSNEESLKAGTATGFVFDHATVEGLLWAADRALEYYGQPNLWRKIITTAMQQDFSWEKSAHRYKALYREALQH